MAITAIGGDIVYKGESKFELRNPESHLMEEKHFERVGMIAAGSGITPMY